MAFDAEVAEQVCTKLRGGQPIAYICATQGMPSTDDLRKWIGSSPDFANAYALAHLEGRPARGYDPEVGEKMCEELAAGGTLRTICEKADAPSVSTVMAWRAKNKDFSASYQIAQQTRVELWVDESVAIADKATPADVKVAELRCSERRWQATKILSRVYGDRLGLDVQGEVTVKAERQFAELTPDEQLFKVRAAFFLLATMEHELLKPGADEHARGLFQRTMAHIRQRAAVELPLEREVPALCR